MYASLMMGDLYVVGNLGTLIVVTVFVVTVFVCYAEHNVHFYNIISINTTTKS